MFSIWKTYILEYILKFFLRNKILISLKINFYKRLQKLIALIFTNFYSD